MKNTEIYDTWTKFMEDEKYDKFFIRPRILKDVRTNFLAYPLIIKNSKFFSRKSLQIYLQSKITD